MDYTKIATAALEQRAKLIAEIRSIEDDKVLSVAEKRERVEKIDADVLALEAEARGAVERGEREAETRALFDSSGIRVGGPVADKAEFRHEGEWLASELRALSGSVGAGMAFTPAANADYFFDRLAAKSVLLASGVRVVGTDRDSLNIPRLLTGATADFTAEATSLVTGDATADVLTAVPRKLSHIVTMSSEVAMDAQPDLMRIYGDEIVRALSLRFDLGCFEGSGSAPQIRGLKNVSGVNQQSMGTNGATPTNFDFVADALTTIESNNGIPGAIVMSPRTWGTLKKVKEITGSNKPVLQDSAGSVSQGLQRSIYGVPVYISSQLSLTETQGTANNASSVYIYDPSQLVVVNRYGVSVESSTQALFSTDQIMVRGLMRADMVVAQPSAVVRVAGLLP